MSRKSSIARPDLDEPESQDGYARHFSRARNFLVVPVILTCIVRCGGRDIDRFHGNNWRARGTDDYGARCKSAARLQSRSP